MTNRTDFSHFKSWWEIIWISFFGFPSMISLVIGVMFIRYSVYKIYDPENYLDPWQRPLAQNYAILKLVLGGGLGILVGSIFSYFVSRPKPRGAQGKLLLFWLILINLGALVLCSGGLPKPEEHYLIPLTAITVAWSPFRIAFVPGWIMGCGLGFFVAALKMIRENL
ncbi:MAG: hypothetical protein JXA33_00750 [Anaerolineae bacterium]|nr:hypothetical protein [Anaerolineae bacterium]